MEATAVEAETKPTLIEVFIGEIGEHYILLTVRDYLSGETLGEKLTISAIVDEPKWKIVSTFYPLETEIPAVNIKNMRQIMDAYRNMREDIAELRGRDDRGQHAEQIRDLEKQNQVQKMIVEVAMFSLLGVWPHRLRDIGL